jgi:hypothetical protein
MVLDVIHNSLGQDQISAVCCKLDILYSALSVNDPWLWRNSYYVHSSCIIEWVQPVVLQTSAGKVPGDFDATIDYKVAAVARLR